MISPASRFIRCINSRAVVDLPQPDSPTIPTVSPLAMENDTSSTARTVLRALNRSPRSSTGSSISIDAPVSFMALVPDVHGAAHSVAEQVEADRHREDHRAGQCRHPWIDVDRGAQRVEHQTPFRLWRFGAEAEEGQARRQDHRHRDEAGRVNENRTQDVAEHVHAHDGEGAGAGRPRRLDEIHIPHAGGDALGDTGDLRHEYHRTGDDGVDDARTEHARNRDHNAGANHADLVAYDAAADRRPVTARLAGGLGLEGRVRHCAHGADTHLLQLRLIRGSIAACAISTMRFKNTKNSASTRIVPCSSGRSRWKIAELSNSPEPGHENTVSIRIEPPSMYPSCSPITAIAVGAAFLMT